MSTPITPHERELVAAAAVRRARFLRLEVESGTLPAQLADEYARQADRLELLYPGAITCATTAPRSRSRRACQSRRRRG